jgi:hypothetical protein
MRWILTLLCPILLAAAPAPEPEYVSPKDRVPEYGHGLTEADARGGWISLFDGATTFGWSAGAVDHGALTGGTSTASFGACELRADVVRGGDLLCGDQRLTLRPGPTSARLEPKGPAPIRLDGVQLRALCVRPVVKPLRWKGNWSVIPHPTLPRQRQATWTASSDGTTLRAASGPGCVELPGLYGDFVLQLAVTCRKPLANAGVFVRSIPGDFLNGYEAQVFNGCEGGDALRPAHYATGGIDDRQNCRRVVSRDGEPFVMTIVATGPHLATWVNGVQVTDWTDERPPNRNAREGCRTDPGAIQLQAHDKGTDVEFSGVTIQSFTKSGTE